MGETETKSKNARILNDSGFTMLEMIFSLSVFLLLVSLLAIGLPTILNHSVNKSGIKRMEWEVFSSQIKKEIRTSEQLTVMSDKIFLKKEDKIILFERYGTSLRRRVDYTGHEILLQNVKSFQFREIQSGFEIYVKDTENEEYYTSVFPLFEQEEVTP